MRRADRLKLYAENYEFESTCTWERRESMERNRSAFVRMLGRKTLVKTKQTNIALYIME